MRLVHPISCLTSTVEVTVFAIVQRLLVHFMFCIVTPCTVSNRSINTRVSIADTEYKRRHRCITIFRGSSPAARTSASRILKCSVLHSTDVRRSGTLHKLVPRYRVAQRNKQTNCEMISYNLKKNYFFKVLLYRPCNNTERYVVMVDYIQATSGHVHRDVTKVSTLN
jgi:hypothetical protein